MFRKQFKVKTSTTIKGSDRRKLRSLVENSFPKLSSDDINMLIPIKGEMNQVKGMTHSGSIVMIYYCGTNPVFFQIEDICYPTVYTLWKYPKLLPTVTTIPPVLEKITNGADLMAPGVVTDELRISELNDLKVKDICAVRISGNMSPIAVGIALLSVEELSEDGIKGKAVSIVHTHNDTLWLSGDQQEPPLLLEPKIEEIVEEVENESWCEEALEISMPNMRLLNDETDSQDEDDENENISEDEKNIIESDSTPEYSMDEILYNSFLTAIKVHGKKMTFPILTSTFYSMYVLKSCPSVLNLDIKKTTHKKLSVFLKKMQKDGIVQIKELTKGVESIVSINLENQILQSFHMHPIFKNHISTEKEKCTEEDPSANIQGNYKFPTVTELFVVSCQVKELFENFDIKKGYTLPISVIRDTIRRYVNENSLQNPSNPKEVVLDPILYRALKRKERKDVLVWEEIFEGVVARMPHAYQVEFEGKQPIMKKGKLEPIQVTVETRTANKKVTLIQNLETYGINPDKLAHHVQVAVAASTSIVPCQNNKSMQVLIQGNQVRYLQKLFLEIYKVPRKYIQGLENVPPKKK